jgi:hypothetical protein
MHGLKRDPFGPPKVDVVIEAVSRFQSKIKQFMKGLWKVAASRIGLFPHSIFFKKN